MEEKQIKRIFDKEFNGMPNPVFCFPIKYFEHGNFVCEVARAQKEPLPRDYARLRKSPLYVFNALFFTDKLFVTVLEKYNDGYRRTGLSDTIDRIEDLQDFITQKLN